MATIFIKFSTEDDRVRGFYELIRNARFGSLPGEIYQIPKDALSLLDHSGINYRQATDEEVKLANDQIRNPSPALL